jgi:hypothetical protein
MVYSGSSFYFLYSRKHWELENIDDLSKFFANIMALFPNDVYLFLDGGVYSPEIRDFINKHSLSNSRFSLDEELNKCSILPITIAIIDKMVYFADNHAKPEIATDIYVYRDGRYLLQWFDIFDDPIWIAAEIPEESIRIFCESTGTTYKLKEHD